MLLTWEERRVVHVTAEPVVSQPVSGDFIFSLEKSGWR